MFACHYIYIVGLIMPYNGSGIMCVKSEISLYIFIELVAQYVPRPLLFLCFSVSVTVNTEAVRSVLKLHAAS